MADETVTFLVALADPTKSLHDTDSGWSISGDYVRVCTIPFPSPRVQGWFEGGALIAVDPKDVRFFYTRKELNAMEKPEVIKVAHDWKIKVTRDDDQGKEKSKEQLIDDIVAKLGYE